MGRVGSIEINALIFVDFAAFLAKDLEFGAKMFVDLTDDMSSDDASAAVLNRSRTVNICGVKRESTG